MRYSLNVTDIVNKLHSDLMEYITNSIDVGYSEIDLDGLVMYIIECAIEAAEPELTCGQNHINFIDEIAGKRLVGNPINETVLPLKFNFAGLNCVGNRGTNFVFFQSRP
jgi:hypothetical protein